MESYWLSNDTKYGVEIRYFRNGKVAGMIIADSRIFKKGTYRANCYYSKKAMFFTNRTDAKKWIEEQCGDRISAPFGL